MELAVADLKVAVYHVLLEFYGRSMTLFFVVSCPHYLFRYCARTARKEDPETERKRSIMSTNRSKNSLDADHKK